MQEYLSKSAQRDALRGEAEGVEAQLRAAREQLQRAGLAQAAQNERLQAFEKQLAEQKLECQEARNVWVHFVSRYLVLELVPNSVFSVLFPILVVPLLSTFACFSIFARSNAQPTCLSRVLYTPML